MKESEKELEILEISLKQPSSLALHEDRPQVVVSEEKERHKDVNKNSEETKKQHFQSQKEIEIQMLKDRKKSLIDRRARILEDDISKTDSQKQATNEPDRDREETITLEKNMFFFLQSLLHFLVKTLSLKEMPHMKSGVTRSTVYKETRCTQNLLFGRLLVSH